MGPKPPAPPPNASSRLHPQHPNVDYAYYLKGLSSFGPGPRPAGALPAAGHDQARPGRRPRLASTSSPSSPAASPTAATPRTPRRAWVYLRNLLAAYEVHVGHYYLKRRGLCRRRQPRSLRGRELPGNPGRRRWPGDHGRSLPSPGSRRPGQAPAWKPSKLSYPDNASLKDGEFVAAKAGATPAPGWPRPPGPDPKAASRRRHMETQAAKDVIQAVRGCRAGDPPPN